MAPIGGGPPVGSTGGTFTGAAEALEIVGDHGLALSGLFDSSTSAYTMLNFTSGNSYLVGTLTCSGAIDNTSPAVGLISVFTLSFNGTEVMQLKTDTDGEKSPMTISMDILIPPFTAVEVEGIDNGAVAARKTGASIVGRIYR